MTTETKELSPFLQKQAEIMAERAQQDRDIEERQKHSLVPAVNEAEQSKINPKTLVIDRLNLETGETSSRVVQLTPQPTQRFVKPAPLALDEVREQLVNAGNSIDAAKERYHSDTDSLDAFYAEQKVLKLGIAELQQQLAEKQARLTELESQGTPKDRFLRDILAGERDVVSVAGGLLTTLCEQASQKIFGIPFIELSEDGKRDTEARYRKVLHRFVTGAYTSLARESGRTTNVGTLVPVSADRVASRADQLLADLEVLINTYFSE